jgi:hypothetical protein
VAEGQPVCAVGEEWIASAGVGKGVVDANEPTVERWGVLGEIQVLGCADEEAVTPLTTRPVMMTASQRRMERRRCCGVGVGMGWAAL